MLGKFKKGKTRKEFLDHVARSRFDE